MIAFERANYARWTEAIAAEQDRYAIFQEWTRHMKHITTYLAATLLSASVGCDDTDLDLRSSSNRVAHGAENRSEQSGRKDGLASSRKLLVSDSRRDSRTGSTTERLPSNSGVRSDDPRHYKADQLTFSREIYPFLKTHCLKCHGPRKQEGHFRVDKDLPNNFLDRDVTWRWSEVLNVLDKGEMPPKKEVKPGAVKVTKITAWISKERLRAERARRSGRVVLRRMNREEYNNTIRDLIGVKMQLVDKLPEDSSAGGFDNNGGALTISPFHLELYLKAARAILDRALVDESLGPGTIKWHFEMENGRPGSPNRRVRVKENSSWRVHLNASHRKPYKGNVVLRHWGEGCSVSYFYVPRAGEYIIRIRAAARVPSEKQAREEGVQVHLRKQEERESKISDPLKRKESRQRFNKWRLPSVKRHHATDRSYRYGPPRLRVLGYLGSRRPVLAAFDVTAPLDQPKVHEVRALLTTEKTSLNFQNDYRIPYAPHFNPHHLVQRDDFPRPELFIDWIEIEGPVYDAWPPSSHTRILINSPNKGRNEAVYAREVIGSFMRRAFRREIGTAEVKPYLKLFKKVRGNKESFQEAIKVPLAAVLVSPHFLYLVEEKPVDVAVKRERERDDQELTQYQLASRLSYFLWSSVPDEVLLDLAKAGRLKGEAVLRRQVDRMLKDGRSKAFIKNFTGQWLGLREIGANPPVANRYDEHLEVSMRGESEAFFEHILRNDLSVMDFLSSDYLVINERLARYYDIRNVKGDHFRPVKMPASMQRGGLVTQASILSITSNGTRTSPVRRGVWILERLLGDPPPPPPPNVGEIPSSADQGRKRVTVRKRLQIHRTNPQCARCHDKIDPLGFALENFDHAGSWREREGRRRDSPPIDASAQLPDGTKFNGVEGLQAQLLKRKSQFLQCLSRKMYTYALGRELGYADEPVIKEAVRYMRAKRMTLRSLLHHVVSSRVFHRK